MAWMKPIGRLRTRIRGCILWVDPAMKDILAVFLFQLALLGMSTTGYVLIEGWNWMDGFYFTFITLTTIGFGEIHELSTAGRLFTIFVAMLGIGSVAFIAGRSAQLLLAGRRLREARMKKKIGYMKHHYILCGHGRIGKRIADHLAHSDVSFVVIDHDKEEIKHLREKGFPFIEGDAEDEETLLEARIRSAKGLILALPEDSANVFVTLVAREINPSVFILARTNSLKNRRKLIHAGANKVINPDEIGADRMAQAILKPRVDEFMDQVLRSGELGRMLDEVTVGRGSSLAGNTLAQSRLGERFDVRVIAVIAGETRKARFDFSEHETIRENDTLIVMGSPETIRNLHEEGGLP